MKVFITKYAFTYGIQEVEVDETHDPSMVCCSQSHYTSYYGEGKEWHRTKESAIRRAEEMKIKKIALLEEQIIRLQKLKFDE